MKKVLILWSAVICACLLTTSGARAADLTGVYATPKLFYGYTMMDKIKGSATGTVNGTEFDLGSAKKRDGDSVFGGGVALGYDFNPKFGVPIRTEVEYTAFTRAKGHAHSNNSLDVGGTTLARSDLSFKQKIDIQTLFLNAYYDFRNSTAFTPYLGAGIGMAFLGTKSSASWEVGGTDTTVLSRHDSAKDNHRTNLAFNGTAGVGWEINDRFTLDMGYRFAHFGKARSATTRTESALGEADFNSRSSKLYMHQAMLGLRINF